MKKVLLTSVLLPSVALAQPFGVPIVTAPASLDFTQIVVAIIGGLFTILTAWLGMVINGKVKDAASRAVLSTAVNSSLGALQNAIDANLQSHPLQAVVPGLTAPMAASVQYVLDHADKEIDWLNSRGYDLTAEKIAEKIAARTGLTSSIVSVMPTGARITHG